MAGFIELIAKIKPKNNGTFAMVDAEDVEYEGKRLPEYLGQKKAYTLPSDGVILPNVMYFLGELKSNASVTFSTEADDGDMIFISFSIGNNLVSISTTSANHVGLSKLIIRENTSYELIGLYYDNTWSFVINEQEG